MKSFSEGALNRKRPKAGTALLSLFMALVLALTLCPQSAQAVEKNIALDKAFATEGRSGVHSAEAYETDAAGHKILTVGYFSGDDRFLKGQSDDERKSGYGYDYLIEMAPYAQFHYRYKYGTYDEMIQALKDGEVDLVIGAHKSDAEDGKILLSDLGLGINNLQEASGMTNALEERFIAVNANNPGLMDEIDAAQTNMLTSAPLFTVNEYVKYYSEGSDSQALTPYEKEYLENKDSIKFGYILLNPPISAQDDEGNPTGVAGALITYAGQYLNTDIEAIAYDTQADMEAALEADEIDAAFPIYSDPWRSEKNKVVETDPLINDRVLIAYLGEYNANTMDKVAVSKTGLGQRYFLEQYYPDSEIVVYPRRINCVEAMAAGEATALIGASSVLSYFILTQAGNYDLNVAYLDGTEDFCIGINEAHPTLAAIMKKMVRQVDPSRVTETLVQSSAFETPVTWVDVIQQYAVGIIALFIVVFGIIIGVFLAYRRRVNIFNKEQAKMRDALQESFNAATNASEAKTAFLSSMSHDIRTPMNGIIGMTAIATANIDNKARVEDCLSKISSSSKHLLALINEVLDVSKIESGKIDLNEEEFNLSDMMDDLMVLNRSQALAKRQHLTVHAVDVTNEVVIGDRLRLQQVVTNLVGNAVKYTPEDGHIDITLAQRPSGNPKIGCFEFIVADDGIGISEEYLPHIFEAFTRADDRKALGQQGTGLGMPIALNIVRMMNGDITVKSKLGEGSTFTATVFLKLADSDEGPIPELIDKEVLVIDDDPGACETTILMLEGLGMKGESATSGEKALAEIQQRKEADNPYFAIIVDWMMPGMDGVETLKRIREMMGDEIPVIVMSAYDWSNIEVEARLAGAEYFVSKPLFRSHLLRLFEELAGIGDFAKEDDLNAITAQVSFKGRRALLAEDNDLNAEIAIDFLGMSDLEIERAVNGEEAVEMMLKSEPGYYDCILMDIQMPIMNGLEAAEKIRTSDHPDAKTIPIFAMTADAFVDDVKASAGVGMNEHFAKPLEFDTVIKTMAKYIAS